MPGSTLLGVNCTLGWLELGYDEIERDAVDRSRVDLPIHCTQSPDSFLPTTACLLHDRLGPSRLRAAFDINLGCSQ